MRPVPLPLVASVPLFFGLAQAAGAPPGRPAAERPLPALARLSTTRPAPASYAKALAFAPGGQSVASVHQDGSVRLWDTATGCLLRVRARPGGDRFTSLAFAPDGGLLAAGRFDGGGACLFEPDTARPPRVVGTLGSPEVGVMAVAFSPDGKVLAVGEQWRWIRLIEVGSGQELRRVEGPGFLPGWHYQVNWLAFSADGKALAARSRVKGPGHRRHVGLWDPTTGRALGRLTFEPTENLNGVALAPGGALVAAAVGNGTVRFWGLPSARPLERMPLRLDQPSASPTFTPDALAFSPDGRLLAGACGDLVVWDVTTRREVFKVAGGRDGPWRVAFSPDGRLVASSTADGVPVTWEVAGPPAWQRPGDGRPGTRALAAWCDDLFGADATRAYRAVRGLAASPAEAVRLLGERVRPEPPVAAARLDRLIANLDSDRFAVRQQAAAELAHLGGRAEAALRRACAGQPALEQRRRVEALLARLAEEREPAPRGAVRAIALLEHFGTPAAGRVLQVLAGGAAGAPLTKAAQASLDRLARRPVPDR